MKVILSKFQSIVVFALLISGCSTLQLSSVDEIEKRNYQNAIIDAAIIEKTEIVLLPIIDKNKKKVRVVTWTKYPDSYPIGKEVKTRWGEIWVTLDPDVRSRCQNFPKETRINDIKKLLGLPLDHSRKRTFVVLEVDADSLFRPCANPSTETETCSSKFPENVSHNHIYWYAHHVALSYQEKKGYPWTRLGYTYNWKYGANEIGVAEFVIKKDSKVRAVSVDDTSSYCTK